MRMLSSGIDAGQMDQLFLLMRKPAPIPRNEPRRRKFEKYDRCITFAPSHRINASSRKSIRQLASTSRRTVRPLLLASASAMACGEAPSAGEMEYARLGSTRSKIHPDRK